MVPGERFELPTNGLQNRCSTTELTRHRRTKTDLLRPPLAVNRCDYLDRRRTKQKRGDCIHHWVRSIGRAAKAMTIPIDRPDRRTGQSGTFDNGPRLKPRSGGG